MLTPAEDEFSGVTEGEIGFAGSCVPALIIEVISPTGFRELLPGGGRARRRLTGLPGRASLLSPNVLRASVRLKSHLM
jgi:hypothetical protein